MLHLSIGIIGLPNVGKSTLFNALVKGHKARVADYPFTTIEPNVGMVEVPDERLDKIAATLKLAKKIPATIQFIDIAGLVKNAHKGEGLGNQFLSHIREVDTIIHVIDGFSKEAKPEEDKETINIELELAGIKKPTLYVQNILEKDILNKSKAQNQKSKEIGNTIYICAKTEEELTDLSREEAQEYLKSLGLKESGLNRLIKESYKLLNLITFYTLIPKKQIQAWPVLINTKAPVAASIVHTDMEKGFIAAEVCHFDNLITYTDWQEAHKKGKIRTEGKDYLVQDGDIILFRFNV